VRVRVTTAAVGVVGVVLLVGAVTLVWGLHTVLVGEARAAAAARAAEVARVVGSGGDAGAEVAGDDDVAVAVFGPVGRIRTTAERPADRDALPRLAPGESRVVHLPSDDSSFLAAASSAGAGRTVVLARSLDTVQEPIRALTVLLAVGVPALLLVLGAVTWRAVGRALVPVDEIRAEVDAITASQLHRRVPRRAADDEVGRLADTMNRMLDRLERSRARERRFVADASHELRSPIAAIRQHAEVALARPELGAGLAGVAHAESLRMQDLVDDLLLLARADEGTLAVRREPVDLDDLVLEEAKRLRAQGGPAVDTRGVSAARVDGDPRALRRVLRNLGDNAARHALGRVALAVSGLDGWAELHVDDDGSGIPASDRAVVFERFVRLDGARARTDGGAGLGLAIVAEVVTAHGGTTAVDVSPLGGARLTVRLPLAG
jgi:signal transduction histidine kinase